MNRKITLEPTGKDIWSLAINGKVDRNYTVIRLDTNRYRAIADLNTDYPVTEHFASWIPAMKWLATKATGVEVAR